MNQLKCVDCVAEENNRAPGVAEFIYNGTSLCIRHLRDRIRAVRDTTV